MIEIITTPKTAILFAVIAAIVLDVFLTLAITLAGLPFVSAFAFCTPLSVVVIGAIMIAGAIVFHAHKQIVK